MKTIKLSINSPTEGLLRQTPNNDGIWGNYKFYINEEVAECDFWVVYSKGQKKDDTSRVAPENLVFISGEPEPVYHYAKAFVKKFGVVITTRKDINHPHVIALQPAQPWWVGRNMKADGSIAFSLKFNDFLNEKPLPKKKLISVITSNKGFTKGHNDRIKFVQKLKAHFGDSLDVFGKGINGFEDKWETLKDYKYHIAIENSSFPDYWTEKLADCYLAESFPFYYGCTNLNKYFDPQSYQLIDIYDVDKTIRTIEQGVADDLYEKRFAALMDAKQRVLNEHNIFPLLCSVCDKLDASNPRKTTTVKHEMSYFDIYKIPMLMKRIFYKKFYKYFG
jgi:hypothetical protein